MKVLFAGMRALVYVAGFGLLWGWLALAVRRFDPGLGVVLPESARVLGIVAIAAGGSLLLTCVGLFVLRGHGTPAPFDPPREFIAAGPYKFVRNPMYIGGLTVLLGFGLWQKSTSIVVFTALVAVVVHLFVVFLEEPGLEQRFGSSYINYKQSVNRWRPRSPKQAG